MYSWKYILFAIIVDYSSGYKILGFLPFPTRSHQSSFAPVLQELARRGHDVVYLTSVVPRVSHPKMEVRLIEPFLSRYVEQINFTEFGLMPKYQASHALSAAAIELADLFYGNPQAQEIIHSDESYDAVLMESHLAQEPVSALIHKFGCVGIEVASMGDMAWLNELSGLPDNPAYQVDFKSEYTDTMSLKERIHNLYINWATLIVSYFHLTSMQRIMDKYFNYTGWEGRPPLRRLVSNRSLVLINHDIVIGFPSPLAPHVKSMGGLNIVKNKPLPQNLQKFMDEAPAGVIYFSLGSILKTSEKMNGSFGDAVMNVFRELPQRVLMKWESEYEFHSLPPNVMTSAWFPQNDILAHNNCAVFITHGGYQSISESVYHGVPLLGIPLFADQPKNMKQVASRGFGLYVEFGNVTRYSISWALKELLHNPKYRTEAKRRSGMMRDRRNTGLEDAAYWVEYAIKYPFVLTPRGAYLTFVELHMLDVYFYIFVAPYLLFIVTKRLFRYTKRMVQKR